MTTDMTHHIAILDDHPIVAQGIADVLHTIPGVKCRHTTPTDAANGTFTLYIIDLEMGDTTGFEIIASLRKTAPDCRILVYTMHEEPWVGTKIHQMGVDGAVSKTEPLPILRAAVQAVLNGQKYFSPAFEQPAAPPPGGSVPELSTREQEVLRLITQGLTSEQIATRMCLSHNTVQTYRRRLMGKFNVSNVAQLIYNTKGLI